jgi:hypothetical protein
LGISIAERTRLATLYPAGVELWRFTVRHFTLWDCNWIFRPREATVPEHGKPAFRMMGSQWRRLVEVVTVV